MTDLIPPYVVAVVEDDGFESGDLEVCFRRYRREKSVLSRVQFKHIVIPLNPRTGASDPAAIARDVLGLSPSLVILDLVLCPLDRDQNKKRRELTGISVLRAIAPSLRGIPIIISSDLGNRPHIRKAIGDILAGRSPKDSQIFSKGPQGWPQVAEAIAACATPPEVAISATSTAMLAAFENYFHDITHGRI